MSELYVEKPDFNFKLSETGDSVEISNCGMKINIEVSKYHFYKLFSQLSRGERHELFRNLNEAIL